MVAPPGPTPTPIEGIFHVQTPTQHPRGGWHPRKEAGCPTSGLAQWTTLIEPGFSVGENRSFANGACPQESPGVGSPRHLIEEKDGGTKTHRHRLRRQERIDDALAPAGTAGGPGVALDVQPRAPLADVALSPSSTARSPSSRSNMPTTSASPSAPIGFGTASFQASTGTIGPWQPRTSPRPRSNLYSTIAKILRLQGRSAF